MASNSYDPNEVVINMGSKGEIMGIDKSPPVLGAMGATRNDIESLIGNVDFAILDRELTRNLNAIYPPPPTGIFENQKRCFIEVPYLDKLEREARMKNSYFKKLTDGDVNLDEFFTEKEKPQMAEDRMLFVVKEALMKYGYAEEAIAKQIRVEFAGEIFDDSSLFDLLVKVFHEIQKRMKKDSSFDDMLNNEWIKIKKYN